MGSCCWNAYEGYVSKKCTVLSYVYNFSAADAENYLPLPQGPARLVAVLEAAIADCKKQLSRLKCAMWNDAAMTNYAIALQRAIEHHCRGQSVPDYIAKQCPHHAQLLNAHLESAASLLRADSELRAEVEQLRDTQQRLEEGNMAMAAKIAALQASDDAIGILKRGGRVMIDGEYREFLDPGILDAANKREADLEAENAKLRAERDDAYCAGYNAGHEARCDD